MQWGRGMLGAGGVGVHHLHAFGALQKGGFEFEQPEFESCLHSSSRLCGRKVQTSYTLKQHIHTNVHTYIYAHRVSERVHAFVYAYSHPSVDGWVDGWRAGWLAGWLQTQDQE